MKQERAIDRRRCPSNLCRADGLTISTERKIILQTRVEVSLFGMVSRNNNSHFKTLIGNESSKSEGNPSCLKYPVISVTFGEVEAIFWVMVCILTVTSNSTSIYTLVKSRRRNSNHSIFLVSLLASNLVTATVAHPLLTNAAFTGDIDCSIPEVLFCAIIQFGVLTSLMSSNAIAVDQILAMKLATTNPSLRLNQMVRHPRQVRKYPIMVTTGIWLVSSSLLIALLKRIFKPQITRILTMTLIISILILLVLTYAKLQAFYRRIPVLHRGTMTSRRHRASLNLILLIICGMLLTWLPVMLTYVLKHHSGLHVSDVVMAVAAKWFFLGPLLDPIFYVWVKYNSSTLERNLLVVAC